MRKFALALVLIAWIAPVSAHATSPDDCMLGATSICDSYSDYGNRVDEVIKELTPACPDGVDCSVIARARQDGENAVLLAEEKGIFATRGMTPVTAPGPDASVPDASGTYVDHCHGPESHTVGAANSIGHPVYTMTMTASWCWRTTSETSYLTSVTCCTIVPTVHMIF